MTTNHNSGHTIVPLRNLEVGRSYKLRNPVVLVPTITLMTQDQAHFDSLHNEFHELIYTYSDPHPIFQFQPTVGDDADAFMWFDAESFPDGLETEFLLYVPSAAPSANSWSFAPSSRKGGKSRKYRKNRKNKKRTLKK